MHADHTTSAPCVSVESERWLTVPGWPGYEVSDLGRLRSYWKKQGPHLAVLVSVPKILRGHPRKHGITVDITRHDPSERRTCRIHTLVLEAFVGPCPPGWEACHFPDSDTTNNRLSNLRWDTRRENTLDRIRHGHCNLSRLAIEDIPVIWARLVAGELQGDIAKDYGIVRSAISLINSGRTWGHVTRDLPGRPPWKRSTSRRETSAPWSAKTQLLKEEDIPVIWARLIAGDRTCDIARDYAVSPSTISEIKRGKNWGHITRALQDDPPFRPACRP